MALRRLLRLIYIGLLACFLILPLAITAEARIGSGTSSGSRGSFTYSPPPSTPTAPFAVQPMQRSLSPQMPSPNYAPSYSQPSYRSPGLFGGAGGFGTGLLGGLLGAGLFGLMFGHGWMGGMGGGMSVLGLLLQFALLYFLVKWAFGFFARQSLPLTTAGSASSGISGGAVHPPQPAVQSLNITSQDYAIFEQRLYASQEAYSREDLEALRRLATPEMVMYFADDLARNASQNTVNRVSDVKLLQGDLSEAWSEGSVDYATVAMRFSLIDIVVDRETQRLISGDPHHLKEVTEVWTFRRDNRGAWMISAIQQTE